MQKWELPPNKCTASEGNGKKPLEMCRKQTIQKTEKIHGKRRKRFWIARIPGKVSKNCVKTTKPDGEMLFGFVRNDGVAVFGEKIAKCY